MVVAGFRRSLSFPNNPNRPSKPPKTYHVRSTSLPCRSHPLISQLKDDINGLKSWASKSDNRTTAWLCDGLSRLRTVHESLDDFLSLPQTYESLREQFTFVEKLLEDFLRYVDVYGIFQTIILRLKQDSSAIQMAIRRKNDSKIALYVKSLKKMSKDMSKLISTVQSIGRCNSISAASNGEIEIAEVIRDVNEVTVLVTTAMFNGISSTINGCRMHTSKSSWMMMMMMMGLKLSKEAKKRSVKIEDDHDQCCIYVVDREEFQQVGVESLWGTLRNYKGDDQEVRLMVLKRMQNLEDSISEIESCSERVFRSLINTRVSLLNVLTR